MISMIRKIAVPRSRNLTVVIPEEFLDHKVEIVVFPINDEIDPEVQALSDHSASLIDEWQDSSEDGVWK